MRLEGLWAVNPVNGKKYLVFIADYVLIGYGTGAIMAVPAHDQRDWDFAKKYSIPIIEVIHSPEARDLNKDAYEGEGIMVNSGEFNGIPSTRRRGKSYRLAGSKRPGEKSRSISV